LGDLLDPPLASDFFVHEVELEEVGLLEVLLFLGLDFLFDCGGLRGLCFRRVSSSWLLGLLLLLLFLPLLLFELGLALQPSLLVEDV
jgi:hypothetical protein